jgi:hypothetical protein
VLSLQLSELVSLSITAQSGLDEGGDNLAPIPEPATLLLFGTTATGLALARWRRRKDS